MRVLAIETSCDDTAIAVLEAREKKRPSFKILSDLTSSQVEIHKKWGGVYPTLARREHQKNLVPVLMRALREAELLKSSKFRVQGSKLQSKIKNLEEILGREKYLQKQLKNFFLKYQKPKIDLITVTVGPGLEPCLWVGVNFAKALAYFWDLPVVPTNHIEAHILVNFVDKSQISNLKSQIFPAVCLVVSGGHTQLILMKGLGKYKILGETRDDAAGECFDKTARILGLGYPGGPAIAAEAAKFRVQGSGFKVKLPRPMIYSKDYDFSFSGLKTAVLYDFRKRDQKTRRSKKYIREMATEIQQAIIDVLIKKTIRSAKDFGAKTIISGGGVVANKELRKQLGKKIEEEMPDTKYLIPDRRYSTDNAVMVGAAGYCSYLSKKGRNWKNLRARANLRIDQRIGLC